MLEAADLVVGGRHTETPQAESEASYEGWCRDPEAKVNWHAHIDQIHNLIRGCDPAPGAWTLVNGAKLRLYDARKHPARRFADVAGKPGEIAQIGGESIRIAVQGGLIEVLKVRTEAGQKLSAAAFATSAGLTAGARLDAE
jgi:methionyl-tRNA formyltransferase